MIERDLTLADGATLHYYDSGPASGALPVLWHHGTPNIGTPPAPLADRGVRWLGFDRPGYGGSTPRPDRTVASAAACAAAVADAAGVDRFAVLGHSGGGPHALACAALLPDRVVACAAVSGLAPITAEGLDWFAGMHPRSAASLRAAVAGRAAKEEFEAGAEFDPEAFTPEDHAALAGEWGWFETVVGPAVAGGPGGLVDDDLAYTRPWGFEPGAGRAALLLVHGGSDRMVPCTHSQWLAERTEAELWLHPADGHISVLHHAADALRWLAAAATD